LLFCSVDELQASSAESEKLRKAWNTAEEAIETANGKMGELRIARKGYETEQETLKGEAPSTILGLIGKGFSVALSIFFDGPKGVRLIELDALIMYTWVQSDILNLELSRLDAERDLALAAYNKSGSHTANEKNKPDYETIPIVSVPCPNMCGVTFTSTDAEGLRNLKNYMETKHRDRCGGQYATPAGCGKGYWTCDGRKEDGTERHKPRTCGKMIKYKSTHNGKIISQKCGAQFRNCTNPLFLHNQYLSGTVFGFSTRHAEKGDSSDTTAAITPSFAPASGSSLTASAGDTHTGTVTAPSDIYGAYFYVNGTSQGWFGGGVNTKSLSFSYTFPSDASGSYTMKALVYPVSGNSYGSPTTYSYTVTVSGTTTTTTTTSATTTTTPSTSTQTDDSDDDDTDSDDDDDSSTSSKSPYSLSASSTGSPFQAGDTLALTLSGNESIYSVDWYLDKSPKWLSSISIFSDYKGESGHYESSASYTFPSGYAGDFVFKAVVYTQGNMTRYEHTYTVTLGY